MKKQFLVCLIMVVGIILYAQAPEWLWANSAGSSNYEYSYSIVLDSNGNSYISGYFTGTANFGTIQLVSSGEQDAFTAKIDSEGNWLWAKRAGGTSGDIAIGIALDNDGNVYSSGYFNNTITFGTHILTSAGDDDIYVAKQDSEGNWLWAVGAGTAASDCGFGFETDGNGYFYLTGYFQNTISFGTHTITSAGFKDIFVAKLDSAGNWLWANSAGGPGEDDGFNVTADSSGNCYVTGYFSSTAAFGNTSLTSYGDVDFFIAKLDSAGNWVWAQGAGGQGIDRGWSIRYDGSGNIYAIGVFRLTATFGTTILTSAGASDFFLVKLDSGGNWLWVVRAGGVGDDKGHGLFTTAAGDNYITGMFSNTVAFGSTSLTAMGNGDIFVARLDSGGNWVWAACAGGLYEVAGTNLVLDVQGNSYVIGTFFGTIYIGDDSFTSHGYSDIFVAKLSPGGTGIDDETTLEISDPVSLYDAYPNPFRFATEIPYSVNGAADVRIEVFNLKGQLIWSEKRSPSHTGYYRSTWKGTDMNGKQVSSGLYYYRLSSGKFSDTGKFLLLK